MKAGADGERNAARRGRWQYIEIDDAVFQALHVDGIRQAVTVGRRMGGYRALN